MRTSFEALEWNFYLSFRIITSNLFIEIMGLTGIDSRFDDIPACRALCNWLVNLNAQTISLNGEVNYAMAA